MRSGYFREMIQEGMEPCRARVVAMMAARSRLWLGIIMANGWESDGMDGGLLVMSMRAAAWGRSGSACCSSLKEKAMIACGSWFRAARSVWICCKPSG